MKKKQFKKLIKALSNLQWKDGRPGMIGPQGCTGPAGLGVQYIDVHHGEDHDSWVWVDTDGLPHEIRESGIGTLVGSRSYCRAPKGPGL